MKIKPIYIVVILSIGIPFSIWLFQIPITKEHIFAIAIMGALIALPILYTRLTAEKTTNHRFFIDEAIDRCKDWARITNSIELDVWEADAGFETKTIQDYDPTNPITSINFKVVSSDSKLEGQIVKIVYDYKRGSPISMIVSPSVEARSKPSEGVEIFEASSKKEEKKPQAPIEINVGTNQEKPEAEDNVEPIKPKSRWPKAGWKQ